MLSVLQVLAAVTAFSWSASAGTTMTVTNWGDNPSNLPALLVYTPSNLASNPPIVVGLHPCGGSGPQFMAEFDIPAFADQLGFPVLYPTSGVEDGINCWDCWSNKSLSHNGGGESQGVAAMVSWALTHFNGDPSRVFAIGASSGGMFGNVLAATDPNLFAGIASWSGVPAGCFVGATSSTPANPDQSCATGAKARTLSAAQWAALALGSYPGYTGARPKMLITHGTADTVVSILNFNAQLAQWSTVLGLTFTRNFTCDPTANWKLIVYGDGTKLIGFEVAGATSCRSMTRLRSSSSGFWAAQQPRPWAQPPLRQDNPFHHGDSQRRLWLVIFFNVLRRSDTDRSPRQFHC
ncbi:Alpha/Beta hydrolase protein [Mycena belliarum]|uniref:Alpha/Beta hydrolase protein n=1 Tax=Mycena belliarum TaxID=1033014 RepID=A0AAD6U6X0_9AGAR|nr:Alpha/Beta hydrolase protein [Mycena belliae]